MSKRLRELAEGTLLEPPDPHSASENCSCCNADRLARAVLAALEWGDRIEDLTSRMERAAFPGED